MTSCQVFYCTNEKGHFNDQILPYGEMSFIYCLNLHANLLRPWRFPLISCRDCTIFRQRMCRLGYLSQPFETTIEPCSFPTLSSVLLYELSTYVLVLDEPSAPLPLERDTGMLP
jgi:hypothetical protein